MNVGRTMNRKEQQLLRQRQTTRQLMGVTRLTEHGVVCGRDELLFYLLRPDMEHLDARQSSTAASREFVLVCRLDSKAAEDRELPRRLEKQIQDHGFHVRLAGEQDVKRILAVYYQQDMVTEHFDSIDGERWATEHG